MPSVTLDIALSRLSHPVVTVAIAFLLRKNGRHSLALYYVFVWVSLWTLQISRRKRIFGRKKIVWRDQIAVITGGSHGVGNEIVEQLVEAGCGAVINLDIKAVEEDKKGKERSKVVYYQCDISNAEQVDSVAKSIITEIGHPTILINNAGIIAGKSIIDSTTRDVELTMKVNLIAHFWTVRAFLPGMLEQKKGHIVTISSFLGFVGLPRLADYCASKAGLLGFHESLRFELDHYYSASKIETTLVCPGHIDTGMFEGLKTRPFTDFMMHPMHPKDVADEIIEALKYQRGRDIMMPAYVVLSPLFRVFARPVTQWISEFVGALDAMKEFTGHAKK